MNTEEFVAVGLQQLRQRDHEGFARLLLRASEHGIDVGHLPAALKAPVCWVVDLDVVLGRGVALWLMLSDAVTCPTCQRESWLVHLKLDHGANRFGYRCVRCDG